MPVFDFKSPDGKTYSVTGPDGATPEQAFAMLQQHLGSSVNTGQDVAEAAKAGAISGIGGLGNIRELGVTGASKVAKLITGEEMSPEAQANLNAALKALPTPFAAPSGADLRTAIGTLTQGKPLEDYQPQTTPGKYTKAITETVVNPLSFAGAGSIPLKVGGAVLSGAGSEAAGQATAGTAVEPYARLAGALAGGVTAAKALGPAVERAATPTASELKTAAVSGGQHGGYQAALNSGLELAPQGVAGWSQKVQQGLYNEGLTGGQYGTAPKTWAALDGLQNAPAGGTVTAQNVDALRKTLANISRETQPTAGGAVVATADAAAASRALKSLGNYVENVPASHVLAGDAAAYSAATREANKNYASYARVRDLDARLEKANLTAEGQIAGSVENQIKAKARQIITGNASRGYTPEELAQARLINSGGPVSNTLRHLGRGGAGVIPMMTHAAFAAGTGGASLPVSLAIGVPLYAARKTSQAITQSRANRLAEMLAQRSPLYQDRVNSLAPPDLAPGRAAVVRALLGAQ